MKPRFASLIVASLLLAACAREQTNSDGNGTGKADGTGGREDPVTAPATDGQPSNSGSDTAGPADSASTPPPQPSQQ